MHEYTGSRCDLLCVICTVPIVPYAPPTLSPEPLAVLSLQERVEYMRSLGMSFETAPYPQVDHVIKLMCQIFHTDSAALTLIDSDRTFIRRAPATVNPDKISNWRDTQQSSQVHTLDSSARFLRNWLCQMGIHSGNCDKGNDTNTDKTEKAKFVPTNVVRHIWGRNLSAPPDIFVHKLYEMHFSKGADISQPSCKYFGSR